MYSGFDFEYLSNDITAGNEITDYLNVDENGNTTDDLTILCTNIHRLYYFDDSYCIYDNGVFYSNT